MAKISIFPEKNAIILDDEIFIFAITGAKVVQRCAKNRPLENGKMLKKAENRWRDVVVWHGVTRKCVNHSTRFGGRRVPDKRVQKWLTQMRENHYAFVVYQLKSPTFPNLRQA